MRNLDPKIVHDQVSKDNETRTMTTRMIMTIMMTMKMMTNQDDSRRRSIMIAIIRN